MADIGEPMTSSNLVEHTQIFFIDGDSIKVAETLESISAYFGPGNPSMTPVWSNAFTCHLKDNSTVWVNLRTVTRMVTLV